MKLLVVLALAGVAVAAPQGDSDAEFIPGGGSRRPIGIPAGEDDGISVMFVPTSHGTDGFGIQDVLRALREIFRSDPRDTPVTDGDVSPPRQGPGGFPFQFPFPSIFTRPSFGSFPNIPDFPEIPDVHIDLPDNYDNSTHEIKVINGTRVEMNTTVTKETGDNGGVFFTHIHTVRRLPEDPATEEGADGGDAAGPQDDVSENEVKNENAGVSSPSRSRRWLKWFKNFGGQPSSPLSVSPFYLPFADTPYRHLNTLAAPSDKDDKPVVRGEEEQPAPGPHTRLIPIENNNDIAVNYLGAIPRDINPDAEVFDAELVREDERRFHEGRSQPMRAQPMMSQPMRAQPMMSQPIRSQPMMSQPIRSQPMMSQPIRSQPRRSQPRL